MKPDLSKLIEEFSIEMYVVDAETLQFLYLNPAAEKNTGYSLSELRNHSFSKLTPHSSIADLKLQMSVLRQEGGLKELLLGNCFTRKDGSRYSIDVKIRHLEYEGRPAYIGLAQDASEKQLALDQLHYVLKGASLGFWDLDIQKNTYYVDDRWLEILGYERGEIVVNPQSAPLYIAEQDRARVFEATSKFIVYDDNFTLEFRGQHKLGQPVWIRSSAAVVAREPRSSKPLRMCGTHQDITREKQDELEREEFFKFFNMASDLMMIGRLDGTLTRVNPVTMQIMGYSEDELLQMPITSWVHPEDLELTLRELNKQATSGLTIDFENRCLCKDGSFRWLSWRASYNYEDQLSYATARDITASKQLQLQLRHQQELYTALVENTDDVICHYNQLYRHTYVSPSVSKVWNLKPEDFIGLTRREMGFPSDLCEQFEHAMAAVFATGHPSALVFEAENKNGPARIYWYAFPGLVEDGEVKSIFTVSRDITDYMKTEDELRKMHKLNSLGLLAGGIAHDFNNILTVLFGNIALAKSHIPREHKSHLSLEQAEKAFHRATHLTSQLLTFAKGGDPVKQDVSIASFIKEVVSFDLSGSSVKLVFDAPPNLWKARVDKGQISQVFSNLATNSNQAMPRGGHIYLSIENAVIPAGEVPGLAKGQYLKFTVRDEGIGIDPGDIDKIFDPYFTTRQQGSGLGLGLATVYSIIAKHGGHIAVTSSLGRGTTFTLYLPASDDLIRIEIPFTTPQQQPKPLQASILVMDDEEMIRELCANVLSARGFKVVQAKEGLEAIRLYDAALKQGNPFDCLVMDLTIPGGMGGKDALEEILKLHPKAKAIVSSGYAADQVMANFENYGFKGCITKPFYIATLHEEIRRVLG